MSNYKIGGTNDEYDITFDSGSWTFINDGSSVTQTGWGGITRETDPSDASSIPSETGTKRKATIFIPTAAYNKTPTDSMVYNSSFNCLAGWSASMQWSYESAKGGTQDEIHQDDPQCWVWYNGAYVDLSTTNPGNLFESRSHGYFSYSESSSGSGDDIVWTATILVGLRTSTIPQGFVTDLSVGTIGSCKGILQFVVSAPKGSEDIFTNPSSSQVLGTYTDAEAGSEQDVTDKIHSSVTNLIKATSQSVYVNFPSLCRPTTNIPWLKSSYDLEPYYKGLPSTVYPAIRVRSALFGTLLRSDGTSSTNRGGIYCYYFVPDTDAVQYKLLSGETSIQAALAAGTYKSYCSTTSTRYLMLSLIAGGGAGGRSGRVTNIEGSGGGGGGGGAGCIAIVEVMQNYCVLVEIGAGGTANSSNADGFESRLLLVSSSGNIRAGIVLDGGRAGYAANGSTAGSGGAGGLPYKAASDGYSMGDQITSTYLSLPTTDTFPSSTYIIGTNDIYIVAAAGGGAGGRGGVDAGLPTNNVNGTSGSTGYAASVSSQRLRANDGTFYTISSNYSVGLNGSGNGSPYEGGGGGVAPCAYSTSIGGDPGRGGQADTVRSAENGLRGGGGGGGFYYRDSNRNGGNGGSGGCRVWY